MQKDKDFEDERKSQISYRPSHNLSTSNLRISASIQSYEELVKEKTIMEGKLDQCKQIVKEMEDYYAGEIQGMEKNLNILKQQNMELKGKLYDFE